MESILNLNTILQSSIAVITATIAAYLAYMNLFLQRKKQLRADHDCIKNLLENYKNPDYKMHPLELETGFLAFTGKCLNASEIIGLFLLQDSLIGIKQYLDAKELIEYNEVGKLFLYKDKYATKKSRKYKQILNWLGYLFWSATTYFPLVYLIETYPLAKVNSVITLSTLIVLSAILILIFLKRISGFHSAKQLIKGQHFEPAPNEPIKMTYPVTIETLKEI